VVRAAVAAVAASGRRIQGDVVVLAAVCFAATTFGMVALLDVKAARGGYPPATVAGFLIVVVFAVVVFAFVAFVFVFVRPQGQNVLGRAGRVAATKRAIRGETMVRVQKGAVGAVHSIGSHLHLHPHAHAHAHVGDGLVAPDASVGGCFPVHHHPRFLVLVQGRLQLELLQLLLELVLLILQQLPLHLFLQLHLLLEFQLHIFLFLFPLALLLFLLLFLLLPPALGVLQLLLFPKELGLTGGGNLGRLLLEFLSLQCLLDLILPSVGITGHEEQSIDTLFGPGFVALVVVLTATATATATSVALQRWSQRRRAEGTTLWR